MTQPNQSIPLPDLSRIATVSNAERDSREQEQRQRHSIALFASAGAPERHASINADFSGAWGKAFQHARGKIQEGRGVILGFVGGRGPGKTQMGVELIRWNTFENQKSGLFTSSISFFMEIKASYRSDSECSEREVLDRFTKPSLLVIDEVGKRGGSDWENNLLFELINRRYNKMKNTVLIDNRKKDEFIETIGPSIASRMNEGGGIIECNWESFRG